MADENEKPTLWDGDSKEQKLRRPNIEPKLSNLNAEATEWFPASHNKCSTSSSNKHHDGKYSAQNRLRPGGVNNRTSSSDVIDVGQDTAYLQGEIANISSDPGRFEEVVDSFMQILKSHYDNSEMISQIAETIFTTAIQEASFQYNAARLCVLIELECPLFKRKLEELCKRETEKNLQKAGFAMFLAELYTQTENKNWHNLYNTMNKLLASKDEENIKSVCKILKLCGMLLESHDSSSMSKIIQSLVTQKSSLQQNCQLLIDSVIKLKSCNWGHNDSTMNSCATNGSVPPKSQFHEYSDLDEFYDSAELEDLEDPDELYDPEPEMDEEIQAAFKEFVKMSK